MSRMRSNPKPPLPKSPVRLRSRQVHPSNSSSLQSPPGSLTKSQKPSRLWEADQEAELRPGFYSMSCELRALSKMVKGEIGAEGNTRTANSSGLMENSVPVFERGRFYEEYSARRNERLKRKKGEDVNDDEKGTQYNLGVMQESATTKRRGMAAKKKHLESLKKTVSAVGCEETPRYMLRSMNKENKKPPLPVNIVCSEMTVSATKMVTTRRVRRI